MKRKLILDALNMKHPILYVLFAIIFVACNKNNEQHTYPVLHVNLDETNTVCQIFRTFVVLKA